MHVKLQRQSETDREEPFLTPIEMSEASLHFPDGFTVLQYKLEVHSLTPSFSEIKELLLFFPSKNTLLLLTPELIYVGWHRISHFRNLVQNNILTLPF